MISDDRFKKMAENENGREISVSGSGEPIAMSIAREGGTPEYIAQRAYTLGFIVGKRAGHAEAIRAAAQEAFEMVLQEDADWADEIAKRIIVLTPAASQRLYDLRIAEAVRSAIQGPFVFAIETGGGDWKDGEQCVFGDRTSCQDEVDSLNDELPEKEWCRVVPLYRLSSASAEVEKLEKLEKPIAE